MGEADAALLARCRDGDDGAFAALIKRYEVRLIRLAFQLLDDREEAEDVAQEAFVCLYTSLDAFRGDATVFTWLYRVVVNLCHRRAKKRGRGIIASLADPDSTKAQGTTARDAPHQLMVRSEDHHAVREAVNALPAKYRDVVVLRYFHDLSSREIADILGVRAGTVDWRLHRARKILERRLAHRLHGEG